MPIMDITLVPGQDFTQGSPRNKIEVNKRGKVRRSRIYYFKELRGKKARIKEVKK